MLAEDGRRLQLVFRAVAVEPMERPATQALRNGVLLDKARGRRHPTEKKY